MSCIESAASGFRKNAACEGLWGHQASAMDALSGFFDESVRRLREGSPSSGAIVMPTGCGKTVVAAETAKTLGLRAAVLAPTVQIALQHFEELNERAPDLRASLYYGGSKDLGGGIIVTTYHSALALLEAGKFPETDVAFYDEAHRSLSEKRMQLHGNIAPIGIGLTATPAFSPTRQIWSAFDDVIYDLSIREAVEMGAMSPIRGFILETSVDASGAKLRRQGNLLDEAQAERVLNVLSRNRAAKDFYLEHFKNDPAVVFCITQQHAEEFAGFLRDSGVRASSIHGRISGPERERRLGAFEDGSIDVLTTRDVLIEGWDSKRVLIELCLRPTYSLAVKTHMVGRVARVRDGKESGIVVEFEDAYRSGEQPVLAHHVLDLPTYRQGGLIAAPKKKLEAEERALKRNMDVTVRGDLKVSFTAREVFSLDLSERNLRNPRLLREILSTASIPEYLQKRAGAERRKPNLAGLSETTLRQVHLDHPEYHGSLQKLAFHVFGIRRGTSPDFPSREDYLHLIDYAYDDQPRKAHDKTAAPISNGSIWISQPPDVICDALRKKAVLAEILGTLPKEQAVSLALVNGYGMDANEDRDYTYKEIAAILGIPHHRIPILHGRALDSLSQIEFWKKIRGFTDAEEPANPDKLASVVFDKRIPLRYRDTMLQALYFIHPSDRTTFYTKVLNGPFRLSSRMFFGVMLVHELKELAKASKGNCLQLDEVSRNSKYPRHVRNEASSAIQTVVMAANDNKARYPLDDIRFWGSSWEAQSVARNPNVSYNVRVAAGKAYVNYLEKEMGRCVKEGRNAEYGSLYFVTYQLTNLFSSLKSLCEEDTLPSEIRSLAEGVRQYSEMRYQKYLG